MSGFADFSNSLTEDQRLGIIKRGNPQMNDQQASEYLYALEERYERKQAMLERGFSNALAEKSLDKSGWPRPFGWHSVFFFPDSDRLRNRYALILLIVVVFGVWKFSLNG